jgi:hypothetical protein
MAAAREITVLRAARDENYWAVQRMAIADKLANAPAFNWKSLAFATPVLAGLLGVAMLLPSIEQNLAPGKQNQTISAQNKYAEMSDDDLLAAVNDGIERETPQALMAAEQLHTERTKFLEGNK